MKTTMKAALIHDFNGIDGITIEQVSIPTPQADEVQIAVKYAGINPVDWKITQGLLKIRLEHHLPIILGWDVAGEISKVGSAVKKFKVGDPVYAYCRKDFVRDGAYAEYICLNAENVAFKPKTLSFAQASCIPLSSLTAWQSLYNAANLKSKNTILIHAGAGGVGGFAIQFAKNSSAYVITTASKGNHDYVKRFGADEVIDYSKENFVEAIRKKHPKGLDFVYDTVGGDTFKESYRVVKEGGHLLTIIHGIVDQDLASKFKIKADFVFVHPDGKNLTEIGNLIDAGKVIPPNVEELPFDQIIPALHRSHERHVRGKMTLKVS